MLLLFGPPIADTVPPTVQITSPAEGQVLDYEEDFDLVITLDDDRRPQIIDTFIFFDDVQAADAILINKTHTFPVNGGDPPGGHGLSDGPHTIRVDITDESGNPGTAEVTFEIVGSPVEQPSGSTGAGSDDGVDESGDTGDLPGGTGTSGATGLDMGSGDDGCSCNGVRSRPGTGALLLLVLAGLRRRRARSSRRA